jgi:hypothetical protein
MCGLAAIHYLSFCLFVFETVCDYKDRDGLKALILLSQPLDIV